MVAHPTADPRRTIGWTEAAFGSSGMVGRSGAARSSVSLSARNVCDSYGRSSNTRDLYSRCGRMQTCWER